MNEFVFIVQEHDGSGLCYTHRICKIKEDAEHMAKEIDQDLEYKYRHSRCIIVEKYFLD